MSAPLIAICVGHSRFIGGKRDGGAVSVENVNEWTYNRDLALKIHQALVNLGVSSFVEDEYRGSGYTDSMKWLASELKARGATLAIELHFNASDSHGNGHEWLFWQSSAKSSQLAGHLSREFDKINTGIKARGTKPKTNGDRGAEFLKLTHCPAVICEPGFGDNAHDWEALTSRKGDIAKAYATGIIRFLTV